MPARKTQLKIKVKTLAAEARIIKDEERRLSRKARKLYEKGKGDHPARSRMLATLRDIQDHRKGIVRDAARINHLAYGFLRGRSYEQMERYADTEPDWDAIEKVAMRFGGDPGEFKRWRSHARAYYELPQWRKLRKGAA